MMSRLLPFLLIMGILSLGFFGLMHESNDAPSTSSYRKAPNLTITPLAGYESPSLSSLKNQFVLVNFFASWCGPCEVEMDVLKDLPDEIVIYGIAWRDREAQLQQWLLDMPKAYDYIAMDKESETSIFYGSTGVPESFLINMQGEIIMHHAGPLTEDIVNNTLLPTLEKARM